MNEKFVIAIKCMYASDNIAEMYYASGKISFGFPYFNDSPNDSDVIVFDTLSEAKECLNTIFKIENHKLKFIYLNNFDFGENNFVGLPYIVKIKFSTETVFELT